MVGNSFDRIFLEADQSGSQKTENLNWLDILYGNLAAATPPVMEAMAQDSGTDRSERKSLTSPAEKKVEWNKDVFKAYDQAVLERKPLIVKFETDWCDYCKDLDQKVLTDQRFANIASKAVLVAANPEKDKVAADLGKQLGVDGYPTVVVMDARPDMLDEIGRVVGFLPADKFMPQLQKLMPADSLASPQPLIVDNSNAPKPLQPDAVKQPMVSEPSLSDSVAALFPSWGSILEDLMFYPSPPKAPCRKSRPGCHERKQYSV